MGGLSLFRQIIFVMVAIVGAIGLFFASYAYFKNAELGRAKNRILLYQSTLAAALDRFEHLPHILARDPLVLGALSGRGRDELNQRLAGFASKAKVDAIYLMDATGLTIASSNYRDELTFLGQDYGFRPYFQEAMADGQGEFFAIGATTGRPGYFIAEAVYRSDGEPLGVLAIKVDLSALVEVWESGGEGIFVANPDGILVLASNDLWRYRTLDRLSDKRLKEIARDRQFANEPLTPLDWSEKVDDLVSLSDDQFLHIEAPVDKLGWRLHYLADEGRVRERAWFTLIAAAIIGSSLFALFFYRRTLRVQTALQTSQALNAKLAKEIEERRAAERRLEDAQSELAQASKLAALGHLSASVTHELGQPLAAMRNYLTAAELDANSVVSELAANLGRVLQRMENTTKQLRFFAAPGDEALETFDLNDAASSALDLVQHDLNASKVDVDLDLANGLALIRGNRFRVEQVVINLLRNAIAAMQDARARQLSIKVSSIQKTAEIVIADRGHGLSGASLDELCQPFHSTRPSGEGMGLGLAISAAIVREHDGKLVARERSDGGAVFTVRIPLARRS